MDAPDKQKGIIIITKPTHKKSIHLMIHAYVHGRLSEIMYKNVIKQYVLNSP